MECFGYPNLTIRWKDNHGNNIPLNKNKKHEKFEAHRIYNEDEINKGKTMLRIKYLNPRDSGIYTLQLSNNNETRQEKFELFVKGIFLLQYIFVICIQNLIIINVYRKTMFRC